MIQVSESTRALLTASFPWTERSVQVNGKGLMTTFVLDPADVPAARPMVMPELDPLRAIPAEGLPSLAVS